MVTDEAQHDLDVKDAVFTPDSRFILTIGADNLLKVWRADDGRLALKPRRVLKGAAQLLVSPDSRHAIVAGEMSGVIVFDMSELLDDPQYDLQQLKAMSELMAIATIDNGTLLNLSTRRWYDRWLDYSTRFNH